MYLSRWYRRPAGSEPIVELRGVDSRFLKYLAVPGDADSLSITLAIDPDDGELRRALSDPDRFDMACRALPGPDQFFAEELEPLTSVRPMGGLINRLRTSPTRRRSPWCSGCTPSATPTRAPTRSTDGAARWRWPRRRCSPTPSPPIPTTRSAARGDVRGGVDA